jgi:myosin heavy subunit
MDIENFKVEIQKLVDKILEQKDFAGIEKETEEVLNTANTALTETCTKLTETESKLADSLTTIETMGKEKESLTTEISTLKADLDKVSNEKSDLSNRLAEIDKAAKEAEDLKRMDIRMGELSSLKVARSGDALDSQKSKVKCMTDEEFASYRDELVAIRSDFTASTPVVEGVAIAPVVPAVLESEGAITTPPADIGKSKESAAIVVPTSVDDSGDRIKKYSEAFSKYMDERNKRAPKK